MMKRFFAIAPTAIVAILGFSMAGIASAQAVDFTYNWKGDNGYSATGLFSYDQTNAPSVISEEGLGSTSFLKSISLSVFDPSNNLLDSGTSVVNSSSDDSFFVFKFDTEAKNVELLNVSTDAPDKDTYYFLRNVRIVDGSLVDIGSSNFNFFLRTKSTNTSTFLDSGSSIQVSDVPEPASIMGVFMAGVLGAALKKRATCQKV